MISLPLQLGFLGSGNGSSARAILAAIDAGELFAEARVAISNSRKAPILAWAQAQNLAVACVPTQSDPDQADARLVGELTDHGVELLILSGYLRRLGPRTLAAFAGRILNIHPGPLPRFGGEGMYGRRVHEAVIAAGVSESGAVIHVVDEVYDHGPVVARRATPVLAGDTAETLEARVRAMEPQFYVETLQQIVAGTVKLP